MVKNREINGTEEIALVTPTPGVLTQATIVGWNSYICIVLWCRLCLKFEDCVFFTNILKSTLVKNVYIIFEWNTESCLQRSN